MPQWWLYRLVWYCGPSLQTTLSAAQKKRERKWGQTSSPEVETLIGSSKQTHTCSQSRTYASLSNASAALRKAFFFFFSSSITARPYLIHFKQWCLLWWISNVRELENYYLDLAVFFGWPVVTQFLQGALALVSHLQKLSPSLPVSLEMSEIDLLLAKFRRLTPWGERERTKETLL